MSNQSIQPAEAASALAEIQARRDQVISESMIPNWYWAAIGVLMLGFMAAIETRQPWVVAVGSVGYGVGLTLVITRLTRRHRAQVSNRMLGVRGVLAITVMAVSLVGIGLATGFGLEALGTPRPATISGAVTAVAMTISGPLLMRYLRGVMTARPLGEG
ncbi:hypothetical protein GCM10027290_35230 [Micromonospora sonneratiae]|uniref:Uncharacterized protein n=1 Tax=Micromonospora sonneratiae TaxID=1184706 RepID=A0ABW3YB15_9ACTN